MTDLQKLYQLRFGKYIEFRKKMWRVLCEDFFQKYIPQDAVILEVGAGFCEFINNIQGKKKIALDLNPDVKKFAADGVGVILSSCEKMQDLKDDSCDVVFVSNLFEHLTKEAIINTFNEIRRVLKRGGRLLILQPNIRFCYKNYWNFFDHITPLDDRSLAEVLEIHDFRIIKSYPRLLPFTMIKSRVPKSIWLIRIYLKIPILYSIFGGQAFICAQKV